uniref:RRM domain-containing protein n=1 Tax=Timema poppense TaxID=170557 RepID=A0A7R9DD29_TIMPO|nr:unnamed protein product [Timema poppensis]
MSGNGHALYLPPHCIQLVVLNPPVKMCNVQGYTEYRGGPPNFGVGVLPTTPPEVDDDAAAANLVTRLNLSVPPPNLEQVCHRPPSGYRGNNFVPPRLAKQGHLHARTHYIYKNGRGFYRRKYAPQRVPTALSPSNASSSSTGSQSGTHSTTISNNVGAGNSTGGSGTLGQENLSKTNLYIRGLTQNTTDRDLVTMCSSYGKIISTKAILDKNTNKCKGFHSTQRGVLQRSPASIISTESSYGFVDFDRPESAEAAVQALQAKGIQAQMAKVGIAWMRSRRPPTVRLHACAMQEKGRQQEQDPTNLYIANLPLHYKENDVDQMLVKFGQVISTRILRDTSGQSKGVGFARMESKEKCDYIIQALNGKSVPECRDPLLVKFADGGNKKRIGYKNPDQRIWRETGDTSLVSTGKFLLSLNLRPGPSVIVPLAPLPPARGSMPPNVAPTPEQKGGPSGYDPSGMTPNGVAGQHMLAPSLAQYSRHYQTQTMQGYTLPSAPWGVTMPQYVMQPAAHMAQVDMMPSADHSSVQYMPQLTAQMSALQFSTAGSYISPHAYSFYAGPGTSIIHALPMGDADQASTATSPDEAYQPYPQGPK